MRNRADFVILLILAIVGWALAIGLICEGWTP